MLKILVGHNCLQLIIYSVLVTRKSRVGRLAIGWQAAKMARHHGVRVAISWQAEKTDRPANRPRHDFYLKIRCGQSAYNCTGTQMGCPAKVNNSQHDTPIAHFIMSKLDIHTI